MSWTSVTILNNGETVSELNQLPVSLGANWDEIIYTNNSTSDVYEYLKNSVVMQTITINYTDSTKDVISNILKS